MKPLSRMTVMLLVACSLQNCQDVPFQSFESSVPAQVKASKQLKSPKNKHAFTISAIVSEDIFPHNNIMVSLRGTNGSITVNWGDATFSTYTLEDEFFLEKTYESPGRYHISITGDLKNITGFQASYGQGSFDDINLKPLSNLKSLRINSVAGLGVIDVRYSKNLEELTLTDVSGLREIRLPQQHSLWAVSIAACINLTTSTVDALINSVYQTAVKKDIWGFLNVGTSHFDEGGTEMVGPPSPESVAQLIELQNTYNWEITPVMPSAVN